MYTTLEPSKIIDTLARLEARVGERFPDSGLSRLARQLTAMAGVSAARARDLSRPNMALRTGVGTLILAGVAAQIAAARFLRLQPATLDAAALVQGLEAAVNLLLLFGGAVWFLLSVETRWKRTRALAALHELRSLAHIIDMHQLTKDPTTVLSAPAPTASSPKREMNQFQLTRYLEYCAEMLALIGKLAALFGENMRDGVVVDAVNDIENLAANLGRKIWQKIMILGQLREHAG
ncbi:MAG TPA: hypothetical protein VG735_13135 [Caulobacterales bacterium]|nr:hypothetical protein [Caulobacterales bacterium]